MNYDENGIEKDGITALVVEPLKEPYIKTISNGLKALQNEVGGNIEAIFPFDDSSAIVLNSDGKFRGLAPNRALYDYEGQLCDVIAGTFLVLGTAEGEFCSLSEEQAMRYMEKYKVPERFSYINGVTTVIPVPVDRNEKSEKHMENGSTDVKSHNRKLGKRNRADEER